MISKGRIIIVVYIYIYIYSFRFILFLYQWGHPAGKNPRVPTPLTNLLKSSKKTKPTVFHSSCDVVESLVIGLRRPQDGGERAPGS